MLYGLEQGRVEKQILKESQRLGHPIPKKIANAPSLQPGLALYYTAFLRLTSCRASGWELGPIPWTAIIQYADELGLRGDQRDDMVHHIEALDSAYIRHNKKKSSKNGQPQGIPATNQKTRQRT